MIIDELYAHRLEIAEDINHIRHHLPLLRRLASGCDVITEIGTHVGFSTVAFLVARPRRMRCIDVRFQPGFDEVRQAVPEGTVLEMWQGDSIAVGAIPPTGLLFIDAAHTYQQVSSELALHGGQASRYIVLHDIVACPDIVPAIREWLADHPEWEVGDWDVAQSGMAVLRRREIAIR